jgi:hypothetical protein
MSSATTVGPRVVVEVDRRPHDHFVVLVEEQVERDAAIDLGC